MARRLRNAAALTQLGKLVPRKIRECRDRLSTRLVRHQPQRQLVAPAVSQDRVALRGVHLPCTLPFSTLGLSTANICQKSQAIRCSVLSAEG